MSWLADPVQWWELLLALLIYDIVSGMLSRL